MLETCLTPQAVIKELKVAAWSLSLGATIRIETGETLGKYVAAWEWQVSGSRNGQLRSQRLLAGNKINCFTLKEQKSI